MINTMELDQALLAYRENFNRKNPEFENKTHWENEQYKWIAIKHFQDNLNIDAENFADMFKEATAKCYNLLSSKSYYPRKMTVSKPRSPDYLNAHGERIQTIRGIEDLIQLKKNLVTANTVAIFGEGAISLEIAAQLRKYGGKNYHNTEIKQIARQIYYV